jgi:hypothetical protein
MALLHRVPIMKEISEIAEEFTKKVLEDEEKEKQREKTKKSKQEKQIIKS